MFTAITTAITTLFAVITTLCSAANKSAKALENLATIGEEMSGTHLDNTRAEREAQMAIIRANRAKGIVGTDTNTVPKLGA